MERHLQRLTWKNIQQLVPGKIDTILFPVGTVEAHGAAALGTDNYIPESIAEYLADKIDALIAPTVNYGITKSLYGYPGSLTVNPDSLKNYVADILKSFHDTGFKKVLLLNGHGGNNSVLKDVAHSFFNTCRVKIAVIHWWELCGELSREFFGEQGGHAALDEAAMVQAIDESLVDKSLYEKDMAYYYRPGADIYPVPGTILLYKEGEGYPDYDPEKARRLQSKILSLIHI